MRERIERFRYRFKLWRREQREDSWWRPQPALVDGGDRSKMANPKFRALLTESTWRFIFRQIGFYFGGLILFTAICRLIVWLAPTARGAVSLAHVVLVCLWTLLIVYGGIEISRRRKVYRAEGN